MAKARERQKTIRDLLASNGIVYVTDLATRLGVSEMTVRRDLSDLEHYGIARRTHGGAEKIVSRSYEPPFEYRMAEASEDKQRIAREAVSFVSEGDTIAIDTGTTTLEFARLLSDFRNLTVVTPSVHVAAVFLSHPSIRVLIAGGEIRKHEGSLVGDLTRQFFDHLYFDTFFISTAAMSEEAGLTEYSLEDTAIKHQIMLRSKRTIALMLSNKFGKIAFANVCTLADIAAVVTDREPPPELERALIESRTEIRTVPPEGEEAWIG